MMRIGVRRSHRLPRQNGCIWSTIVTWSDPMFYRSREAASKTPETPETKRLKKCKGQKAVKTGEKPLKGPLFDLSGRDAGRKLGANQQ